MTRWYIRRSHEIIPPTLLAREPKPSAQRMGLAKQRNVPYFWPQILESQMAQCQEFLFPLLDRPKELRSKLSAYSNPKPKLTPIFESYHWRKKGTAAHIKEKWGKERQKKKNLCLQTPTRGLFKPPCLAT